MAVRHCSWGYIYMHPGAGASPFAQKTHEISHMKHSESLGVGTRCRASDSQFRGE